VDQPILLIMKAEKGAHRRGQKRGYVVQSSKTTKYFVNVPADEMKMPPIKALQIATLSTLEEIKSARRP
jgi:hypothetical protein